MNTITILLGGLIAVAPQIMPLVPHSYADLATAILAMLVAVFHLYQTPPNHGRN